MGTMERLTAIMREFPRAYPQELDNHKSIELEETNTITIKLELFKNYVQTVV